MAKRKDRDRGAIKLVAGRNTKVVQGKNIWGNPCEALVYIPEKEYVDPVLNKRVIKYPAGYAYGAEPQKNCGTFQ